MRFQQDRADAVQFIKALRRLSPKSGDCLAMGPPKHASKDEAPLEAKPAKGTQDGQIQRTFDKLGTK